MFTPRAARRAACALALSSGILFSPSFNDSAQAQTLSSASFSNETASSLTANWASTYPGGTLFYAQLSTSASFAAPLTSSNTFALSATFSGLTPNTTYYAQVATAPAGPFTSLGSTVTWVQAPTSVYFDEITTHSIVASAYAPTPAFTNLGYGLSGTNLARDGAYAGWHGERWTTKAAMTGARYGLFAAAADGKIYAMGGYSGVPLTTNAEYDPVLNTWTAKAALPEANNVPGLASYAGSVYLFGGENTGGIRIASRRYDPGTNAWTTLTSLPSARTAPGVVALEGKLYSVGGAGASGYLTLNDAYDPVTGVWSSRAPLPWANHATGQATQGSKAYFIGGFNGISFSSNVVYDAPTNSWATRAAAPLARSYFALAAIGGKLFAIGGHNDVAPSLDANQEYDPAADAWTARSPMPTSRTRLAWAVHAGRAYLIGGSNGSALATNEEYDPGVAQQFTGLQPNTQYTFKAKARNLAGVETGETASFSTYTLAAAPTGAALSALGSSSVAFSWASGGNPAGTEFQAELALSTSFASPSLSGWGADLSSAVFDGLSAATTYYARVQARNAVGVPSGYTAVLSTRTAYAPVPGCGLTRDVAKSGAPYATITAALAAVPASLSVETCVVIRDTETYSEQVTVAGKTTNGLRLRILADPVLTAHPTVAPPALSTAAFVIQSASVSLEGLRVAPGLALMYGVQISTLYARLDRMLVVGTSAFANAGVGLDSAAIIENSTVSVGASRGIWSSLPTQVDNLIRRSSVTNASPSLHAVWLIGRRNALIDSFARNSASGTAVALGADARLEGSTATVGAAVAGGSVVLTAANASSVTVRRSMIESPTASFGLIFSGGEGHLVSETTVTVAGANPAGISLTGVNRSTLSRVHVYSPGTAVQATAGAAWNLIEFSTIVTGSGGSYSALSLIGASNTVVSASVLRGPDSLALYLQSSSGISVFASTISGRGPLGAAYFFDSSGNMLSDSYVYSPTATALDLRGGSSANTVRRTRLVSGASAGYALYLTTAAGNSVIESRVENTAGYAAFLGAKADGNLIDLSTVTAQVSGYSSLYLDNAATNTFTRSYFANPAGTGVTFGAGASSNTLSMSTVAASGAAAKGLFLFMASDSFVYDSWLVGGGYPLYTDLATRALVLRSTVSSSGSVPAALVAGSSGVVLRDSYVGGSDAVYVYSSTATTLERTVLRGTGGSAKALQFLGGSNGLWVSSAVLSASSVGIVIEDGARGPIALSSFTVAASTGLQFQGGTQVATVSLAGFLAGTGANVDASGLGAASRVTLRDAFGPGAGTRYENDPLSLVDWIPDANPVIYAGPFSGVSSAALTTSWTSGFPAGTQFIARLSTDAAFLGATLSSATLNSAAAFSGLSTGSTYYAQVATAAGGPFTALGSTRTRFADIPGCAVSRFVAKDGSGDCTRIQTCVDLIPSTPLTGDHCIAVMDSGVYSERVTVSGKDPNGFRIRLWGAGAVRPTVNPPVGSTAGIRLANSSVTLSDVNVVTTNTVNFGVWASSPDVSLANLGVDSGGRINGAGIFLSSRATVAYASVTVQNAEGVLVTGSSNTVSFTTASVTAFSRAAFYLSGAWGNSVSDSTGTGNPGYGAFLIRSHGNTLARSALRKVSATAGASGLYLNNASSNTLTGCFVSNANGTGADLAVSADHNLVELSTITTSGSVYTALELGHGRGNRVSRIYAQSANGNASTLSSGISESLVENSTFYTAVAGAAALSTNGSSDTLTGNMLYAPNGIALALNGSSITVSRTAGFTATPSFSAFYVGSGGLVTVQDSSFENAAGDGGRIERASYVDILRSTLTAAGGGTALKLEGASSNTVTASRLASPGGVGLSVGSYLELFDMTTTTGSGNAFRSLDVSASTAVSLGAAPGVELSSSVLAGDASGAAIAFGDAVLVATFTGVVFPSGAPTSVEAALLPAGSRITIRDASGPLGGSLFEFDPSNLVDWVPDAVPFVLPTPPAECVNVLYVRKRGGGHCTDIQACVDLLPTAPLTADWCVLVADSSDYGPFVIRDKDANGRRISIAGTDPGARPTVRNAGLVAGPSVLVAASSVTLRNLSVAGPFNGEGVVVSSAFALLDSIEVAYIEPAAAPADASALSISSWTTVLRSSVLADVSAIFGPVNALKVTGVGSLVSNSTVTGAGSAVFIAVAVMDASSNAFVRNSISGTGFCPMFIGAAPGSAPSASNSIDLSTVTGRAVGNALCLSNAIGTVVDRSYLESQNGSALSFDTANGPVNATAVLRSTLTTAVPPPGIIAAPAVIGQYADAFLLADSWVLSPEGSGIQLTAGWASIVRSTLAAGWGAAFVKDQFGSFTDHDTVSDSYLSGPYGVYSLGIDRLEIARSTLVATSSEGAALAAEGDFNLNLATSVLLGGPGAGLWLLGSSTSTVSACDISGSTAVRIQGSSFTTVSASRLTGPWGLLAGNQSGDLRLTSVTVRGAALAVSLSTPAVGASLSVSSLTFSGLTSGATAIEFLGGPFISTASSVFFGASAAVNVDGRGLGPSSRVTMRHAGGDRAGPSFEADPFQVVDWSGTSLPTAPLPPAPTPSALGASSISWTWAAATGVWSYEVLSAASGSLLATVATGQFIQTGLSPASTYSLRLAVAGPDEMPLLSPSATGHTLSAPPAGLAALFVTQSSAAVQWTLNGNPPGTFAELQRSTDAAAFSVRAGTLATTAYDTGLLGCTSYYYRVRNRNPVGIDSEFDGPLFVRTPASTPSAPGDLSAQSIPGRRVSLTWTGSATEGVVEYRLYKDTGAGTVDYTAPYAAFGPSVRSTTTVALSTGAIHLFGLRAFHRCGVEERNTHAVASAWALESLDGVRASIKVPATGKKISGNRVLVMAELDTGSSTDVSSILFQYRSTGSATWTDIPAANANHPNPDREQPFFVHWDVSALADRAYDLRAVASDVVGASDPAPGAITVLVDSVAFEVKETDLGGGKVKKEQAVSNETSNTIATAESGSAVVTKVVLPAGALNTSDATISATANPPALPPPPAAATSLGASIEITLSNGQSQLSNGQTAAIVFNYPDDNGDGVIDGTLVRAENAEIQTFDVPTNKWKKEFATVVDKDKKTLTGFTPHFSLFAAFGVVTAGLDQIRVYPNPYKPNAGNADEGRTFSRADPLSGVVFDNLPSVVEIKIYTLTGRLVSTFGTSAGTGAVQWDGKNDAGEDVASGGYFAVITSPGQKTVIKKLAVIR